MYGISLVEFLIVLAGGVVVFFVTYAITSRRQAARLAAQQQAEMDDADLDDPFPRDDLLAKLLSDMNDLDKSEDKPTRNA